MTAHQGIATAPPPRPSGLDRLLAVRIAVNWEVALYVAIFGAAIALRFWDLGARSLHHDESIHANWSFNLLKGDYRHDPVFHGPLYYHAQALVFLIFGASDYTSRVSAAIFGSILCALPLLLRRRIGVVGTVAAVAFIAFSPTIVYYSRFFREDIYMAAFTMAMVVGMWRYIDDGRDRWLFLFALALTGSLATKEATFLTAAVFLLFLNAHLAGDLARQTLDARGTHAPWRQFVFGAALFPYAWAVAALWPFVGGFRRSLHWEKVPRSGDVLVLLGTLLLPLLTPALRPVLEKAGLLGAGRLEYDKSLRGEIAGRDITALLGLFAITVSAAAFVGLQWRPRLWAVIAALCAGIYLTLMTSLWTNLDGLVSGPWGSLDYWITQHGAARADQPWFYYYMLMPAYEFLPLVICAGGIWWSTVRGDVFSRFLVFWLAGTWLALSLAGEKMPWLNTHLALPAAILAGWTLQRAWIAWQPRPRISNAVLSLVSTAAVCMGAFALIAFLPGGPAFAAMRLAIAAVAIGIAVYAARPYGRGSAPAFLAAATIGALALFSLRTMVMVVYERGDVPKDLLIYTQSAPDIPQLRDQIDALASATGKGLDLRIAVDTADSFAWPWAWYLRDYRGASYVDFSSGLPAGEYDVMLVNQSNVGRVNDALLQAGTPRFGSPAKYPHRWWFDETYKSAMSTRPGDLCRNQSGNCGPYNPDTWRTIAEGVFRGGWLDTWWRYFRDHDPGRPPGSVDAFAYFPANFDREKGIVSARPLEPAKPSADGSGRPQFGGIGSLPGQFFAPVDIDSDPDGNLYVIDSATRRLQKFDRNGNFLAAVDVRGDRTGEASQPWGLGVGPDGTVWVADTFGWKVRAFDSNLKPTGVAFGNPPQPDEANPGPFSLYGPRDIAFDRDGNVWVTDTGHARIEVFSPKGEFLRQVGTGTKGNGAGQLDEPVGIAIATDGTAFVADMFNRRVQMFAPDGRSLGSFAVQGWGGQEANDKPYLRVLRDGRLAVSLPSANEVRIYDRSGAVSGSIKPTDEPLTRPYGMAETSDGKLWIVEGGSGRVRLFPLP